MHSLALLLAALAASAASADVKIFWQHEKSSGHTSLSVFNGSKLIAQTCSSMMTAGNSSIDFSDVDSNGFGNFSVGDTKYWAHSKPEYSGGPICTKEYDDDTAVVKCSNVNWTPVADASITIQENCFKEESTREPIRLFTSNKREIAGNAPRAIQPKRNLSERQCQIETTTSLKGDAARGFLATSLPLQDSNSAPNVEPGNPHQNYYWKQISENIDCASSSSCSAGHEVTKSYSIGWSSDISAFGWISGGFSVQEEWSTGDSYTCYGDKGETVCIWYNTAHTAYTVTNAELNTCEGGGWIDDDTFVMYSPNQNNRGGGYKCKIGSDCRAQGDSYWDKSGPAGGPQ